MEKDKAVIFTGYLNALSLALKLYPNIVLNEKQRLSDFDVYGCAIAQALGKTQAEFTAAYVEKVTKQNEEALNSYPVALAVLSFAEKEVKGNNKMSATGDMDTDYWKGTPTELFTKLSTYAQYLGIDIKGGKNWPKSSSILTRRINLAIPALKAVGVEVVSYEGNPRKISIDAKKLKIEAKPIDTTLAGKDEFKERVEKTFAFIKEGSRTVGMVLAETVEDKTALSQLLREGSVYEPKEGYVKATEA